MGCRCGGDGLSPGHRRCGSGNPIGTPPNQRPPVACAGGAGCAQCHHRGARSSLSDARRDVGRAAPDRRAHPRTARGSAAIRPHPAGARPRGGPSARWRRWRRRHSPGVGGMAACMAAAVHRGAIREGAGAAPSAADPRSVAVRGQIPQAAPWQFGVSAGLHALSTKGTSVHTSVTATRKSVHSIAARSLGFMPDGGSTRRGTGRQASAAAAPAAPRRGARSAGAHPSCPNGETEDRWL